MAAAQPLIAGVELGGTKIVALVARGRRILRQARLPTAAPEPTLAGVSRQLAAWRGELGTPAALGIASFGPLGLDPARGDFGQITETAKRGWSGAEVVGHFRRGFDGPIGFDTDVAGAALAEWRWGAGRGQGVVVYITIGTGVGGGVLVDGRPLHGVVHPELGHVRVRRAPGDAFPGACPFHGDCLEGLASGPAIAVRAGVAAETLAPDHPVWTLVAGEVAELAVTLIYALSPHRILIGGGVAAGRPFLLPMIRDGTLARLGGYVAGVSEASLARTIRAPGLGERAGPLGAVALGLSAVQDQRRPRR